MDVICDIIHFEGGRVVISHSCSSQQSSFVCCVTFSVTILYLLGMNSKILGTRSVQPASDKKQKKSDP
jgi:hypothetical protein